MSYWTLLVVELILTRSICPFVSLFVRLCTQMTWHQREGWWRWNGWFMCCALELVSVLSTLTDHCRGFHLVPASDVAASLKALCGGGGETLHHMCSRYRKFIVPPLTNKLLLLFSCLAAHLSEINHKTVFTLVHIMHLHSWTACGAVQVTTYSH